VQLETRETHAIDSAVSTDLFDSELKLRDLRIVFFVRIESAVYHPSRNTA